jgi:hypothetical protein
MVTPLEKPVAADETEPDHHLISDGDCGDDVAQRHVVGLRHGENGWCHRRARPRQRRAMLVVHLKGLRERAVQQRRHLGPGVGTDAEDHCAGLRFPFLGQTPSRLPAFLLRTGARNAHADRIDDVPKCCPPHIVGNISMGGFGCKFSQRG